MTLRSLRIDPRLSAAVTAAGHRRFGRAGARQLLELGDAGVVDPPTGQAMAKLGIVADVVRGGGNRSRSIDAHGVIVGRCEPPAIRPWDIFTRQRSQPRPADPAPQRYCGPSSSWRRAAATRTCARSLARIRRTTSPKEKGSAAALA